MTTTKCEQILSSQFPPWDKLSENEKNDLLANSQLHNYAKGDTLHRGDIDCIGVLLIVSGELRIYMLSEEGREITLYRLYDKDFCVLSASCAISSITFDVHIEAGTDTRLLIIDAPAFERVAEANIYAECFAYKLTSERFSDVMWAMQQMLFMSLDKRLAIFLNDEMVKTNSLDLYLTHEEIANNIGSAREAVSRILKYFVAEGIVELSRGIITIVDKIKLRMLAQS